VRALLSRAPVGAVLERLAPPPEVVNHVSRVGARRPS